MTGARDELALEARVSGATPEYRFETADGVCSPDSFRPSELLLADVLWDADADRVRVRQANYGVVGVLVAASCEHVEMTEASARAVDLCERNAAANGVDAAVYLTSGLSTLARDWDVTSGAVDGGDGTSVAVDDAGGAEIVDAVAYAPKPYTPLAVGAQRIADALTRLSPGGRVFVAAAKHTGLSRYESVLRELCEEVRCVARRDGYRVLEATIAGRASGPSVLPTYTSTREFDATVDGTDLSLVSVPGVFSATELDAGTRLLAETASVAEDERVLDLCCGYGALGAYAARSADCTVWLTDDDRIATACGGRSLDASGVDGTVVTADGVAGVEGMTFDRILCNPPTHATDHVLRNLFDGAHEVLRWNGDLFVVFHRDLDLRPQLAAFDAVETLACGAEHVVVRAKKSRHGGASNSAAFRPTGAEGRL